MTIDEMKKALREVSAGLVAEADLIKDQIDGKIVPRGERNRWVDVYNLLDADVELVRIMERLEAYSNGEDPPDFGDPLRENEDG